MILDQLVSVLGLRIDDRGLPAFRASLGATIAKIGLVSAGAFTLAGAIGQLFDIAGDTADGARAARNLGLPYDSLQRLEFAAKQTGVSVGSLRGAIAGLASSARQAATVGNDAFVTALGNIGVSMRDANGKLKTGRQLLLDIADAVKGASNENFALVNAEALGLGPEFISFLRLGSGGIEALGSQIETTSERAVEASLRFERAMDRMRATMRDFVIEGGTPVLEGLAGFGERLLEASRSPGFAEFKREMEDLGSTLKSVATDVGSFWSSVAEAIPKDSRQDLIQILGLGLLSRSHPLVAGAIVAPMAAEDIAAAIHGEEGTAISGILPGFANKVDQILNGLAFLTEKTLGPVTGIDLPRSELDELVRSAQGAADSAVRSVVQNITIEVKTPDEAADAVEALTSGSIEDGLGDRRTRVVK